MTVEELAEEVMAPRLHMASFALQLENLQDDPFAPGRYKWGWLRVVHGIELLQSCHSNFVNVSLL